MSPDPSGEGPILDIGCGTGHILAEFPDGSVGVRGTAGALPFRSESIGGLLSNHAYQHLPPADLPLALADLHRVLEIDAPAEIVMAADNSRDVLVGAGFRIEGFEHRRSDECPPLLARIRRSRTLPDIVGTHMRLLVCGLNPSVYSADVAVGFGRPGNRFWPAALAAGIVTEDRDPRHALTHHGVGMTDLVKRATPRADELTREEYADGVARLDRLCAWLRPEAVCMVGLAGWRAAVNRKAVAGWQDETLGERPVYVMPSTSGLNAHSSLADLADHLREVTSRRDRSLPKDPEVL